MANTEQISQNAQKRFVHSLEVDKFVFHKMKCSKIRMESYLSGKKSYDSKTANRFGFWNRDVGK